MIETYESGKPLPARFSRRGKELQLACLELLYPSSVEEAAKVASYGMVYCLNRMWQMQTTTRELLPVLKLLLAEKATLDPQLPIEQQKARLQAFIGEGPVAIARVGGCSEDCYTSRLGASPRIYHDPACPLYAGLDDVKVWTDPLPGLIRVLNPSQEILTARLRSHAKLSSFFLRPGTQEYSLPMWAELGLPDQSAYKLERIEIDQPVYRIQFRDPAKTFL